MKKKTFIVLLTFLTAASLTSCGRNNNIKTEETTVMTETTAAETESATIEPQELDAFDKVAYYIDKKSGAYRDNGTFTIKLDLKESPYADYMHYNLEMLSADCETIKLRATAQTDELINWLNDRKCTFKTNTFDFEIHVADIPCMLITENQYTDNSTEIDKAIAEKIADEVSESVELKEVYLTLPKTTEFDISGQESLSCNKTDGTNNRSDVILKQSDAEYSVYEIFESENGFYLVSCTPFFKAGVYEIGYTYSDYSMDMETYNDDCDFSEEVFATIEDAINSLNDLEENSDVRLVKIKR